jgi:hypothetical protein
MSDNIVDLSNLDSWDLMKELNKRGYYTNLIFSPSDIDMVLSGINGNRDEEDGNIIELSQEDKEDILQSTAINTDWFCERINESLEEHILDYYDDEVYYKKVDNVKENS